MAKSLGKLDKDNDVLKFDGWMAQNPSSERLRAALKALKDANYEDFTGEGHDAIRHAVLDYIHLTTHPAPTRRLTEKLRRIRATVQKNKRGKNV